MNMLTKGTALAGAVCALLISAPAAYADHDNGWDYAKVVRAEPIYREVRVSAPREVCREEPVTERTVYRGQPDPGAVLIGGIIGGVIGHQFGGGHGKDVATAAGAVIGANHAAANSGYHSGRVVERTVYHETCHTVRHARYEERIDGYDVTYKYHGRLYHTRTPYHPGKRIRVQVDVAPVYEDD
jgi:uncharacterized protein YcfJ